MAVGTAMPPWNSLPEATHITWAAMVVAAEKGLTASDEKEPAASN